MAYQHPGDYSLPYPQYSTPPRNHDYGSGDVILFSPLAAHQTLANKADLPANGYLNPSSSSRSPDDRVEPQPNENTAVTDALKRAGYNTIEDLMRAYGLVSTEEGYRTVSDIIQELIEQVKQREVNGTGEELRGQAYGPATVALNNEERGFSPKANTGGGQARNNSRPDGLQVPEPSGNGVETFYPLGYIQDDQERHELEPNKQDPDAFPYRACAEDDNIQQPYGPVVTAFHPQNPGVLLFEPDDNIQQPYGSVGGSSHLQSFRSPFADPEDALEPIDQGPTNQSNNARAGPNIIISHGAYAGIAEMANAWLQQRVVGSTGPPSQDPLEIIFEDQYGREHHARIIFGVYGLVRMEDPPSQDPSHAAFVDGHGGEGHAHRAFEASGYAEDSGAEDQGYGDGDDEMSEPPSGGVRNLPLRPTTQIYNIRHVHGDFNNYNSIG
ncbi:hypothetical protein BDV96DRAFT_644193 [Lophiotrema nucula]|uniref:Uncharacterized protein n=1 Tax=Lophiotrema nucula TaxID=690887 RepID=A0A6A5ZF32_9PLEO|nr:hypothetical protein BDV96DRAFT_644193 [Lophiotrema nucula]